MEHIEFAFEGNLFYEIVVGLKNPWAMLLWIHISTTSADYCFKDDYYLEQYPWISKENYTKAKKCLDDAGLILHVPHSRGFYGVTSCLEYAIRNREAKRLAEMVLL